MTRTRRLTAELILSSPETVKLLVDAGNALAADTVVTSPQHELLMQLAGEHANWMAKRRNLSHKDFDARARQIREETGMMAAEIVAMAYDPRASAEEIAGRLWQSWRRSRLHWKTARRPHKCFGAGMARAANGAWYSCIIAAD